MNDERVSRSASFALAAQLVGGLLTGILTIFLGRQLSLTQFGAFTFALSIITIATLFADFGVGSATGRFVAERRHQPHAAAAVFRTSLRLKLVTGIPATVFLFVFAAPLCDAFGVPSAEWALRWCAIALFSSTVFQLFLGVFIALGKLRYNVVLATIESVAEVGASIVLVLITATAAAASVGRAVGFTVGVTAAMLLVRRTLDTGGTQASSAAADAEPVSSRQILGYAGPLLIVDAAFRVFTSIDVLLIAAIIGGGAPVAAFGLPMRLTVFAEYPAAAVAAAVAPRLTKRRNAEDVELLVRSMRYLTILQVLVTVPLIIWPEAIVHLLFGNKYPDAADVMRALTPFVLLSGIAQLTTLTVNYLGEAWRRVPIAAVMLAANVVIDLVLIPKIGIVGGAIGTSVAYAIWVPAHVWILRQRGVLKVRPFLLTLTRSALAGAVMLGVLALIGTGQVPFPLMLLGAIVGPAAYLLTLFLLRELGRDDIAQLRRVLPRAVSA
jgi:O-antigen/teichoic acid export membrane protein